MENINNNRLSDKLNEYFKENIKFSFVSEESIIIVTKNDKYYQFERKDFESRIKNSIIALSNNESKVKSLLEESFVEVLSYKQVIDFKTNNKEIFILTIDGKVYVCNRSELRRVGDVIMFEKLFQILVNETVIEMSCGYIHKLFLTTCGVVFEWDGEKPIKLKAFENEKIKAISCGCFHSMALTESCQVYVWKYNHSVQLGIGDRIICHSPVFVKLDESLVYEKMCCGLHHSLLLSRDGDIYFFDNNGSDELGTTDQKFIVTPTKLSHSEKFINIASHPKYSFYAALSKNSVYYIWGKFGQQIITKPKVTELNSFNCIFEKYFGITLKPVEGRVIQFKDDLIQNDEYEKKFIETKKIGRGSYGNVYEVKERNEKYKFAIKKIQFIKSYEAEFMKELETSPIIYKLSHENIAKYFDVWLENGYTLENGIKCYNRNFILYIQMELCDKSLNDIIHEIKSVSSFCTKETLTSLAYFISSQIFIQILEGVNFLHKQNPPIIHRDLNPSNILLKNEKRKNSVVKIADFGLATIHEYVNQSHTQDTGHDEFLAPEVRNSSKYDTRSDIYSLGIVLRKLFRIDINRDYEVQKESQVEYFFMGKYQKISNLCDKMTQRRVHNRHESIHEILEEKQLWTLKFNEFNYKKEFEKALNSKDISESFFFKILNKLIFYKKDKYSRKFVERRKICRGSFGEVFAVMKKYDSKNTSAIQKISLNTMNDELMSELKIIYELSHKNIVEVFDIWFENIILEEFTIYIQMELFGRTLAEIIEEIKNDSKLCSNETLTLFGCYLASEIFIGILEGIIHLHEKNPPIIHKNLNPCNILIEIKYNWYMTVHEMCRRDLVVKIAEISLNDFLDYWCLSQTEDQVFKDYRAQEVRFNKSYNTRADVYSLGLVLKDLFLIDINRDYNILNESQSKSVLMNKYSEISNLYDRMTAKNVIERPDIQSILVEKHLWSVNWEEFSFN